ncbi:hypothetical protein E5676_scaffold156G00880 [Cucumis melo var. makuwa]|uniref:DUF4218 domain-containing protein n=1 Tax=Cucumis melo var. makuwa TaxID=1194695 RepID=A0A5D3BIG6_CUCMM|nr:hypothetical protein E5676_scaffold156G00880 [Cucumis melo var. makuwa]
MQDDIVLILCKLEKIFPPAFSDVMVHLAVHLPWEARIVGPIGYSWIYPIERFNRGDRNDEDIDDEEINNSGLSIFSQHIRWLGGVVFRQLTPDELEKSHYWLHELAKHREHMRILESSNGNGDLYKRQQLRIPYLVQRKEIESNELEGTSDETLSTCYPRVEHNLDSQTFNREDIEPSIIGDQEDIIAQSNEEASTDEALVDEEDFDSNNSSDEMSSRNFGSRNRSRSSSNMNEPSNSNQNSIGEQEVVSIDSDIQSSSTKTKGQGATRRVGLEKYVQENGPSRIRIDFEDRKPIYVSKEVKREIVDGLSNYFILDVNEPLVQDYLEHEMSVLYRDFRCSLHKSYKKYDSPAKARKHRHKRVAWTQIGVVYVIDANEKTLRVDLKQILRHNLNFHSPIEKKEGKEVSEIVLFQLTHSNEKNGWVNEAKEKYDEMVELKTTSSQEGSEPLLEREICEQVLGKRSRHVKGKGCGPRPKNVINETIQHNTKEANAQIAHFQSIVES